MTGVEVMHVWSERCEDNVHYQEVTVILRVMAEKPGQAIGAIVNAIEEMP